MFMDRIRVIITYTCVCACVDKLTNLGLSVRGYALSVCSDLFVEIAVMPLSLPSFRWIGTTGCHFGAQFSLTLVQ